MNKFLALSFASLMAFAGLADSLSNYGVIDYVKSTRTQYLVTDYYPNPKTWMEAVVGFEGTYSTHDKSGAKASSFISAPADSDYACYGLNIGNSTGDDETTIYAWLYKGSGSGESNLYGKQKFGTPLTASTNTLVVQNGTSNSSVTWGGTAMTTIKPRAKTTTCANPLAIFGTTTQPFAHYDFTVYSIKIYESDDGTKGGANEVLKHDFIPVTNNLGVAGLYDRVANKFFSSGSSTELVAGIILPTPTISGTLVMSGWEAGETPSQPSGLTTDLGTLVYRYYTNLACTQAMATPTTATPAGTYYVRGEVDASASWNAAVSAAVAFTVTGTPPTPGENRYYMVGEDSGTGGKSSMYASSAPPTVGWAESVGGTVLEHTVSGDYDYEIPQGATVRTRADTTYGNQDDVFNGRSLTLGGSVMLKRKDNNGAKTVTFSNLIADGDGTDSSGRISAGNSGTEFTLAGAVSVPADKCLVLNVAGAGTYDTRKIYISAAISGAGKILIAGNSTGKDKTLKLQSAASFTGAIGTFADTSLQPNALTLLVTGAFGGSVESLPAATQVTAVKFNYDGLPAGKGLIVSSTGIPEALKTKLILYSSTADFTAKNFRLMTFPYGTVVTPSAFTVKHATSDSGSATAFTKLGTIGNPDGTISLVANYDFVDSLATSTSRVANSPFATGGIVWKLGDDYIHIFTNINGVANFVPSDDLTARVLLVAGGGAGGGSQGAAGGGAGGMVEAVNIELAANEDYAVLVGAGAPSKTGYGNGANGGNSSVSNATAAVCTVALGGGGGGRRTEDGNYCGQDGGSGGGGGSSKATSWLHDPGSGTTGQGNDGGEGYVGNGAGGGGGAGAEGSAGTSSAAGAGGAGKVSAILGYDVIFAGGGGGSWNGSASSDNSKAGAGGVGGGGNGGNGKWSNTASTVYLAPTAGVDGLGGGGGGACAAGTGGVSGGNQICSGRGGDGLVVIRYTDPTKAATLPKVYLTSVTPNNDATATIAWSMTGAAPLTLKAMYGVDSATLNITNTISTTTPGEDSTTLGGLLPGRTYYVSLLAENSYGNSGAMLPTSFTMPADGPMPAKPTAEMPVIASTNIHDKTGLTTIDVLATLSQAGTGSSFADCTATVRWGTENELAKMTSSKSASVASDGTVTISPDNLGTGTYYGCIEVVNAAGYMDRIFFSFVAADTSTYQWKAGVTEGAWKDRNNWTGAPNDWGCGYPTDSSTADMTSVNCATVHVAGVINCAKLKMEKANTKYVFIGDDAAAAVYPANANTTSVQDTILPDGGELVFDGMKVYLLSGGGCYGLEGSAKLVLRNGADATVRRGGDDSKMPFELKSADARLEVEGVGSRITASNYNLASNNKATAGGTIVLSGASPTLNIQSVATGRIYADCFDGTIVCNIPAGGWANPVIPSTKLNKFASGSGSGKIIFTVPKTAPIRGATDKTKTESAIVSCDKGFEVSRVTFGSTAKSSDYFYYTLGDDKYVPCTTNAAKLAAIDAPGVALETQPAVTALKYHHEPSKGLVVILR